jgi:Winged helix DNA-binding domain
VRSFTVGERRARLARRHLLAHPSDTSAAAVAHRFMGLHATDPATPYLSLWARVPGFRVADLDAALYDERTVAKHLAMRRTLWIFDVADLSAVQPAASDRVAANERKKLTADVVKSGVAADGDTWLETAAAAVLRHLAAHGHASARELRAALPELAGDYDPAPGRTWGGSTPLSPRVLTVLGVRGDLIRGHNEGVWTSSRPRWAATSDWLGARPVPIAPDEARATMVRTWLDTFGPATVGDVKWFFGHTLTWAREALRDVEAVEVDLDGTAGFALPDDLDVEPTPDPWCALLPGLDVTTMGWQDRAWYLGEHRGEVFDRNGNAGPTAWCDGRVVGGWRQDAEGRIELQLLEPVGRPYAKKLERQAKQLTDWLGGVRINPRFPSPLSKA